MAIRLDLPGLQNARQKSAAMQSLLGAAGYVRMILALCVLHGGSCASLTQDPSTLREERCSDDRHDDGCLAISL